MRIRVSEADVVLNQLWARGGDHQPGIEDPAVINASAAKLRQGGFHESAGNIVDEVIGDERQWRHRAHTTGIGTDVPVADPFEVLSGGQADRAGSVADGEDRDLGTGEPLLDHHSAAGITERRTRQFVAHVGLGFGQRIGDQDAPTRSQAIGLDHVEPGQGVQECHRCLYFGEGAVTSGGQPGSQSQVFHVGLGALHLGTIGAGAKDPNPLGPQPVRQPIHQQMLRADDHQIYRLVGHQFFYRYRGRAGNDRVAGRDQHLGGAPQDLGERMLTPARPHHHDLHHPSRPLVHDTKVG